MKGSTSIINLYILKYEIYLFPSVSKGDGGASKGIGPYEVIKKDEFDIRFKEVFQRTVSNCIIGEFRNHKNDTSFKEFLKALKVRSQKRLLDEARLIGIKYSEAKIIVMPYYSNFSIKAFSSKKKNQIIYKNPDEVNDFFDHIRMMMELSDREYEELVTR